MGSQSLLKIVLKAHSELEPISDTANEFNNMRLVRSWALGKTYCCCSAKLT